MILSTVIEMSQGQYSYYFILPCSLTLFFYSCHCSYDDDSDHSTKLRKLHPSHSSKKERRIPGSASHSPSYTGSDSVRDYIEHIIKPNETLQGLALLYRCSVILILHKSKRKTSLIILIFYNFRYLN